jgi:DNA topoisomerase-1
MTATREELLEECVPTLAPADAAAAAGLRYVNADEPGITREASGERFRYRLPDGGLLREKRELERISSLAIPPAWRDVWICASADGHLQATGRDARGRKQYRYHQRWRETRDETKYDRMRAFGQALPALRDEIDRCLALPGLPREKVIAAVVRLLERTSIRVGSAEYARDNKSYGLTTMRDQHVRVDASTIRFAFKGKSGVRHTINLSDRRLARIVQRCRDLPGQHLFQYLDDEGEHRAVSSSDVNAFLREKTGQSFTAKDFRTWTGSVLAAGLLREVEPEEHVRDAKRQVSQVIEQVAERLGNTPTICRRCYVHPAVIDAYMEGSLQERLVGAPPLEGLDPGEEALMALLGPEDSAK